MLRFTELRVDSSPGITQAGRVLDLAFRADAYHVAAIFTAALPVDYVLDGAGVLTLQCGPPGDEPSYQHFPGARVVCVDPFDFAAYARTDPATRERTMLALIEQQGLALIARVGADPAPWRAAAAAVRAQDFQRACEVPRLGRALPGRGGKIQVHRCLGAGFGERWEARVLDRSGELIACHTMRTPAALDQRDWFKRSAWEQGVFVVRQRLGPVVFTLAPPTAQGPGSCWRAV
ncbi:hypothetical protein KQ945_02565 [Bacillus subtilis subsp. subtilis]|nr:hypothetical protein [Bacillus subtilis subsp. subtilis]